MILYNPLARFTITEGHANHVTLLTENFYRGWNNLASKKETTWKTNWQQCDNDGGEGEAPSRGPGEENFTPSRECYCEPLLSTRDTYGA